MLLLRCVAETMRMGGRTEIVPISIDLVSFGRRFGVSRSHLRRLLEGAHEKGLLDAPPRNGSHILLSLRLMSSFVTWMASELGNYRLWALAARDALELRAAGGRETTARRHA